MKLSREALIDTLKAHILAFISVNGDKPSTLHIQQDVYKMMQYFYSFDYPTITVYKIGGESMVIAGVFYSLEIEFTEEPILFKVS